MLDQLGAAHHLAFVMEEVAQQLIFLRRQLYRIALQRNLARPRVQPHVARRQFARCIARRPADKRAQPGDQFLALEGLGQIIVRSRVQPRDLVGPAVARGQHKHREGLAFLAPPVEHGQPVDRGQAQVQHDRVIAFGRSQEMPILAIRRQIDGIARAFQRGSELMAQARFILDDQQAHGRVFPFLL